MKGGFKESPLHLNDGIGSLESWNAEAIVTRASLLAKRATEVWPCQLHMNPLWKR